MKKVKVLKLKPTQFAVGMLEVDEKIAQVREYSKKELKAYVDEHPVPVVASPEGDLFVVDRHHFLSVCYHLDIKKVNVDIVEDFRGKSMSYGDFWRWMFKSRNAYPYCQFGEGPRPALYLPKDVRGLADDPYRSLAWFVRKAGGFENSDKNFAEFKWANFFREKRLLDERGLRGMKEAMVEAVKLAQSKAAKKLPGYGLLNLADKTEAVQKARARGRKITEQI